MSVRELSREQLEELKQDYMAELVNEGTFREVMNADCDEPSWGHLAMADELISDEFIFDHYSCFDFGNDDFFCTAGKED